MLQASGLGNAAAVHRLLQSPSVNVLLRDNSGSTALTMAAQFGHVSIVEQLVATGRFDWCANDTSATASAFQAAVISGRAEIVSLLLFGVSQRQHIVGLRGGKL